MRRRYFIPFTLSVLVLLFASDLIAQTAIQKQEGDDQDGVVSTVSVVPGVSGTTAGPSSPTGSGKPPRVGPNRQVNDVQLPFPNGLLGRSETSIAASTDGQFIVGGWNDAQGFCTPVFGGGCDPGNQNGLSGLGFPATAARHTRMEELHPSSTISSLAAIHGWSSVVSITRPSITPTSPSMTRPETASV